ncbi:MAG: nucleotidyltransferase family protein [Candidatus Staskawiczbacteria bacterium]|nr:nucleotidyltransferase family protein [Candidatus Staskawiczbacteria bacterium]
MNVNEIKNKIKNEGPFLREKFRVKKIGIFGSYSRGEQKRSSDIDILVEFYEAPSLLKFIGMEKYLSEILGIKVDLVMKNSLKRYIGEHILNEVIYV